MIIRNCVVTVYSYIISFLHPVSSDMVASVFRGDPRDRAGKRPLPGKNVRLFSRRDAHVAKTRN